MARRYARALILGVRDDAELSVLESDLAKLVALLNQPESLLLTLFENPSFHAAERKAVMAKVYEKLSFSATTCQVLDLLIEKDRITDLPAIKRAFDKEIDTRLSRVRVTLTTALGLKEKEVASITAALAVRLGKSVLPELKVDPTVIGGVKAQVGGLVMDGTLEAQLAFLKKSMNVGSDALWN